MSIAGQLKAVSANIKDRRLDLNFSQTYVAERLKVTQNAYSKMEIGKTKMSVERLYEIANVLETSPGQLINTTALHQIK
ncbi:MAG: helix-turn-helix transcriptional regulator [Bacteroidota bacterium]